MKKIADLDISEIEDLLKQREAIYPAALILSQPPCPQEKKLWRFLSHEMKGKEKRRYEKHLIRCNSCRIFMAEVIRQSPVSTEQKEGVLQTQPPSLDLLLPKETKRPPKVALRHPGPRQKYWRWGFGFAAPAAVAVCMFILLTLTGPKVNMVVHLGQGEALRSTNRAILKSGEVLEKGDSFRAEITSRKDGFVYFFLWNKSQGGEFLFPSPSIPQENRVIKGEHTFVPAEGLWVVDETDKGEETLYLLFSDRLIDFVQLSKISKELEKTSSPTTLAEKILARHFSIEEKITCRKK